MKIVTTRIRIQVWMLRSYSPKSALKLTARQRLPVCVGGAGGGGEGR